MQNICEAGMRLVALYGMVCILKNLLPEGNMRRSAQKAVDMAALAAVVKILAEVLVNG